MECKEAISKSHDKYADRSYSTVAITLQHYDTNKTNIEIPCFEEWLLIDLGNFTLVAAP
jgi:hypothetical protein